MDQNKCTLKKFAFSAVNENPLNAVIIFSVLYLQKKKRVPFQSHLIHLK